MDAETILRNNFPHPAMDFFAMRNSAINYLQQLAGEEWTDFNEHDPGVTILDQLCYAITDLSYRTNYDIRDLLAGKPAYNGRVETPPNPKDPFQREIHKDTFFTLDEIMPCHPLTVNDWRRLIIDGVDKIRNAWIEPLNEDFSHPIGIYRILVEAEENHLYKEVDEKKSAAEQKKQEEENNKEIIDAVRAIFHTNRNLCEDLESVNVLRKREVKIIASIEVDESAHSEEILAKIFFKITDFFSHPIRRYPLNQMLEKGYTVGTIFNGPRLKNGFIPDEELYPLTTQIYYSRIIRAILDLPEVNNICDFRIEGADDDKKVLPLNDMEVPVFSLKTSDIGENGIKLLKNNIAVYLDKNLVTSYYEALRLSQPRPFIQGQHKQSLRAFDVKLGRDRKVGEYRSVQYEFPPVYGIGEFGVGDNASESFMTSESGGKKRTSTRRAGLAQQLKGYLLLFDQVLANYLEQLASVPMLFSIDPQIKRTYFPAMKLDVPRLEPLLKKSAATFANSSQEEYPGEAIHAIDDEMMRMQKSKLMFANEYSYREALDEITNAGDNYFERRNRFLDHLLARFSIAMPARMYEDTNWYFSTIESLHEFILEAKTAALQYVDLLTERRGQAPMFIYQNATAWLESYVRLRLGIVDSTLSLRLEFYKMAEKLIEQNIPARTIRVKNGKREINHLHGLVKNDIAESDEFQPYDQAEKDEDQRRFDVPEFYEELKNNRLHIDMDMLRNGYYANYYRFGKLEGQDTISVIYRDPEDNAASDDRSWKIIGKYPDITSAINGILSLSSFLRYMNLETEGLHIIEHLPLRPPLNDLKFETELLDASGAALLHSKAAFYCEEEQEEIVRKFYAMGRRQDAYTIAPVREKWSVELRDDLHEVFAHSTKLYSTRHEAHSAIEKMIQRCVDLFIKGDTQDESFRFRTLHNGVEIPQLSFYSLSITVIMPTWTARFSNPGFRKTISQLLRNYAPAHISITEFFLEPSEMIEFEDLYEQWRKAWTENDTAVESLGIKLSILMNNYYREIKR
ncbi:MAG: hypothetical protein ABIQ40_00515 [Bacteroidia bacterium]